MINLSDRIKEVTFTIGNGDIALSGTVNGFSSFASAYGNNSPLFYAITDGQFYEIGSGIYFSTTNTIKRFPIKTTNNNQLVNFSAGLKEIYVTYPASHAVFNTSGIYPLPKNSGIAFWTSPNSISYNDKIIFDSGNGRLGIGNPNPSYTVDINGLVRSSGFVVNHSGIIFPSGLGNLVSYSGGTQLVHFEMNNLDKYCVQNGILSNLTGADDLIQLSGAVNQFILLKKQSAGTVFAGPTGDCTPPCNPSYPNFRPLVATDIPPLPYADVLHTHTSLDITDFNSAVNTVNNNPSSVVNSVSGILNTRINNNSNNLLIASGALNSKIDASGASLITLIQASNAHAPTLASDGRLSLSLSDSTAEGTSQVMYFVPHNGNNIFLYNGSSWVPKTFSTQGVALAQNLSPNLNYDVFAYINSSNVIDYEYLPWNSNEYRTTNLVLKDGVYCKNANLTHRYLGTIRKNNNSFVNETTERFISNADNKILIAAQTSYAATSWTAGSAYTIINSFPRLKIIHGLKDIIELYVSFLFLSITTRSAYILKIDSSRINRMGGLVGIDPSFRDFTFHDRWMDVDINDSIQIDLLASAEIMFDGYDEFYPIEARLSGPVTLYNVWPNMEHGFKYIIKY